MALDRAAEREAAKVARAVASGASKGMPAKNVQDHISIITRAQGAVVDITHAEGSRTCTDSIRRITLITPEPLINGAVPFVEIREGVFKSTAKVNDGSNFYVNNFNTLGSHYQSNGVMIKLIPRVIQVYPGTWIRFSKTDNEIMDTFTVYF